MNSQTKKEKKKYGEIMYNDSTNTGERTAISNTKIKIKIAHAEQS